MDVTGRVRSFLPAPGRDPELALSQMAAMSKQLPLLYGMLMVNSLALAASHVGVAPAFLSFLVPGVLSLTCIARVVMWWRRRNRSITAAEAVRGLRTTMLLVPLMGACFVTWSISLYPYGDAYAKLHVVFFMAITVTGCVVCLTHLRAAAIELTAVVLLPFTLYFSFTGNTVVTLIAVNVLVVNCAVMFMLRRNYQDFTRMVQSRREVLARQAETQRLSDENERLAHTDGLTGLPNRRYFLGELHAVLERSRAAGTRFAVALADLDGFKAVNDVHGHAMGDRLLAHVGGILAGFATSTIAVARLGGDEFGVILTGDPSDAEIARFGERLCGVLAGPHDLGPIVAQAPGSAGLVAYPEGGQTAEQLFERADYAMYVAKQSRTGKPVIFSSEHESLIRDAGRLEQALRAADLEAELWVAFQPMVEAASGRTIAFEALARWNSPALGRVAPDVFIQAAERIGIISRLTETLLGKALEAAATWTGGQRISFNLSARDIGSPAIVAAVQGIIAASHVPAARIDLEITETAVMRDFEQATEALAAFRKQGMRISLDDFGTGYSSLSHVHRLMPDKIKIDRAFVTEIRTSKTSRDIVSTIVDLCRNLNMACVVEGVETEQQMQILRTLGCRVMQGYLFSRPMPAEAVAGYLAAEDQVAESRATETLVTTMAAG